MIVMIIILAVVMFFIGNEYNDIKDKDFDDKCILFMLSLMVFIVCALGIYITSPIKVDISKYITVKEAVESGNAEWYINNDGVNAVRWKVDSRRKTND